ncbi:hypothetical protein C9374_002540 [Naegleria lovaniensis]|uniref:Uncharacterized protein n=1 Tax=Naegleria lovaniensis TaxID=51637 RepID=A0AA88KLR6_NAELO|nr:uncharacterized protein C9374_002540 [Naegleria lovaniensis]KAG2386094.1 hypothetical protein C9374_002540 [Naegleria lovaniensis]
MKSLSVRKNERHHDEEINSETISVMTQFSLESTSKKFSATSSAMSSPKTPPSSLKQKKRKSPSLSTPRQVQNFIATVVLEKLKKHFELSTSDQTEFSEKTSVKQNAHNDEHDDREKDRISRVKKKKKKPAWMEIIEEAERNNYHVNEDTKPVENEMSVSAENDFSTQMTKKTSRKSRRKSMNGQNDFLVNEDSELSESDNVEMTISSRKRKKKSTIIVTSDLDINEDYEKNRKRTKQAKILQFFTKQEK